MGISRKRKNFHSPDYSLFSAAPQAGWKLVSTGTTPRMMLTASFPSFSTRLNVMDYRHVTRQRNEQITAGYKKLRQTNSRNVCRNEGG